jgi:hypothetical protein
MGKAAHSTGAAAARFDSQQKPNKMRSGSSSQPSSGAAAASMAAAHRDDGGGGKRSRRASALKAISRFAELDGDDDEEEVPARRRAKASAASAKRKGRPASDDDDDEYHEGANYNQDDARAKAAAASGSGSGKAGDARSMTKADREAELEELRGIWADPPKRTYKSPAERPGYNARREAKAYRGLRQYLDTPFDISDRGVVHIVHEQGRRLRPLLEQALAKTAAGGLPPIHLQTVCSGTDAPALALRLVSDSLSDVGVKMKVRHALSCENEPFKQAYIARNFPGVALFNDVVELASSATEAVANKGASNAASKGGGKLPKPCQKPNLPMASTSFGGERAIPQPPTGHLSVLIAGTSCKDFSARKRASGIKLDIEDMGTSGETFVATIDYLFASAFDICLLENVTSAPWAKMRGYITGRVLLKDVFSKIQSSAKSQGEKVVDVSKKGAIRETLLELEAGDRLVVTQVFPQHGLRLGAVLGGCHTRQAGKTWLDKASLAKLGLKRNGSIELKSLCDKLGLSVTDKSAALLFEMPVRYEASFMQVIAANYGD